MLEVNTHHTVSLLTRPLSLYEELPTLTSVPFLYHAYDGLEPPLVMVVEKATFVPVQIVVCDALTVMVGVTTVLTMTLTLELVAVTVVGHGAFDVSTHQNESELAIVLVP